MILLLTIWLIPLMTGRVTGQDYEVERRKMVSDQLLARGIIDTETLKAMRKVERHLFVPDQNRSQAYNDSPLPIGHGQTISQPYIVAYMTQLLNVSQGDKVLEIGTGSGYQAAILGEIAKEVFTIEIVEALGEQAKRRLKALGYDNVTVIVGDGYSGFQKEAPFDAIMVTAAAGDIPSPLIEQLKDGGKLVMPVGPPEAVQMLVLIEKKKGKIVRKNLTPVRFVPFTRKNQ
jgi:protein-L-isoaspartate(D-aspartate) O-methyltransferase